MMLHGAAAMTKTRAVLRNALACRVRSSFSLALVGNRTPSIPVVKSAATDMVSWKAKK
jgi:hypothetical protein